MHFTPGKKSNMRRILFYIAQINETNRAGIELKCSCQQDKFDKNITGSESASVRTSNAMRVSRILKNARGGKTQYGNSYLGQPLNLNYLGRMEGMAGGSGTPPRNF
jgi:hypothetical protein